MPANHKNSATWKAVLLRHETILAVVLATEWFYFYFTGTSKNFSGHTVGFGTVDAQIDLFRHSCEIAMLALVMTPVILTGGIDLSVGSLLGLSTVFLGFLSQDLQWPMALAVVGTLLLGACAGGLNATLITWLRLPPLIVTLGTFSLFRGLAEAITHGSTIYTGFPESFKALGKGRLLGLPTQAYVFLAVAIIVWLLVHRMTFGRSARAIGYSPEGSRYAGLPVNRQLALIYVLAGFVSALTAIIYAARLNQATADDGKGFELMAITAVVLGGTSIFGGSGSVHGTLLGAATVAVLIQGLDLTHRPPELGGMLTGLMLILALSASALPKILSKWHFRRHTPLPTPQPSSTP